MKRKEIKKKIEEVLKYHTELDSKWEVLEKVLGVDTSVGIANVSWSLFDEYTKAIEREIGDVDQYLSWYLWDNLRGERGLAASSGPTVKKVVIKSVDDLVELIKK